MKKGSLLVEALVTLIIIVFAFGVAFVPSWSLLRKTKENSELISLEELLLNKCEELTYLNVSSIVPQENYEEYNGVKYKVSISKKNIESSDIFTLTSDSTFITFPEITIVTVRVETEDGKYIETQVVPQQW
ncbi:hypothetical protein HNP65_000713 [Thermosipho japonicus]|uniref:Type II secretion system protein n=1 Tax=Thermosipho japonicus TaxID=90323 RepID=A0A841GUF2_9BACT|nr:hypothetical protein [Thermosipho japonicus]MBB6062291.1 hypothetical protein [Thermosipho japonicus]